MRAVPSDTIVACATPPGVGALAVVRLSGKRALQIGTCVAPPLRPRQSHRLCRARVVDSEGRLLDESMVVEMHAPRSYTGEDVVELHVHGAPVVVHSVVAACQAAGARLAEAGEFTLRAFVNGKLDLPQVEAVGDLLAAATEAQQQMAAAHLAGGLSRELVPLVHRLEEILAALRAALDFPEHPTGEGWEEAHQEFIRGVTCKLQGIIESARTDLRRARQVVLCGAPNVGKSSLVNAWAGRRRVLVDALPGTTRDAVEVEMSRGLLRWSVWDTAGVRSDAVGVEQQGIELSFERARTADVALWLVVAEGPVWPPEELSVVVVGSKADLAAESRRASIEREAAERGLPFWGWVSAHSGEGVAALQERLAADASAPLLQDAVVVVRQRQLELLCEAKRALVGVAEAQRGGMTLDVVAMELEGAVRALGQLLGRDVDLAVLERIFAEFCIGK